MSPHRLVAANHQLLSRSQATSTWPHLSNCKTRTVCGTLERKLLSNRGQSEEVNEENKFYAPCQLYLLETRNGFDKAHSSWLGRDGRTGEEGKVAPDITQLSLSFQTRDSAISPCPCPQLKHIPHKVMQSCGSNSTSSDLSSPKSCRNTAFSSLLIEGFSFQQNLP